MGYHVTILRTKNGKQEKILLSEVKDAIIAMPELKMKAGTRGYFEISLSTQRDKEIILLWQNGEIWTKNPDDKTMQIMLNLAKRLNARVRGDDFETYKTPNESYKHQDDLAAIHSSQQIVHMTKKKLWLLRSAIIMFFVILGLLMSYFSRG